jgi:hypothetical protein
VSTGTVASKVAWAVAGGVVAGAVAGLVVAHAFGASSDAQYSLEFAGMAMAFLIATVYGVFRWPRRNAVYLGLGGLLTALASIISLLV